jgi:magnesium-transporting ATPase (P-type)
MNSWGELAAIITSIICIPVSYFVIDDANSEWRILFVAMISLVVSIATVFLVGPENKETLQKFYDQIKPTGFWKPMANESGDDPELNKKALYRSVAAMFICGFSLFNMLVFIGSLLVGAPAPSWLPMNVLWYGILFVLGFGLIPVWYKLGFKDE